MYPETETDIRVFRRYLKRPSKRRLERVVGTYYSPVWRIAVRLSGNEDDASDIAQDVFLSLILNPPEPDGVRSPMGFLTYRAVTRARHMDRAAVRRRNRETEAVRRITAAENFAEADLEEVRDAVRELPEPLRTAVELRYMSRLRNSEIATTLAVSERTVERNLGQARQLLRSRLGKSAIVALFSFGTTWQASGAAAPSPPLGTLFRVLDLGAAIGTASPAAHVATSAFGFQAVKSHPIAAVSIASVLVVGLSIGFMSLHREGTNDQGERPETTGSGAQLVDAPRTLPAEERAVDSETRVRASPAAPPARLMKDRYLLTGRLVEAMTSGSATAIRPVDGAVVEFKPHPRRADPKRAPPPQRIVTGADGTFAFGGIPFGMWLRLEIDAPDRGVRTFSFDLEDPEGEGLIELGDVRLAPGLDLTIAVSGPAGEPVLRASVLVKRTVDPRLQAAGMYESHRPAVEVGDGRYRLERMTPGTLEVKVSAAGYAGFKEHIAVPEEGPISVRLEGGMTIRGLVATLGGEPVGDVELQIKGPGVGVPCPTTRSDADGRFAFDRLSGGEYRIRARADGYVELFKHQVPAGSDAISIGLETESVYGGRIVASGAGAPVPGARVTLTRPGQTASAGTDAHGRFRVRGLAAGSYLVIVDHEHHAPLYTGLVHVRAAEEITDVELRLERGLAVSGTVSDRLTRAGVPGAWAVFTSLDAPEGAQGVKRMAKTEPDGVYTVVGILEGTYSMQVRAPGYVGGQRMIEVTGREGEGFDISLLAGGSISGTVADGKRRPVVGASVFLSLSPTATTAGRDRAATAPRVREIVAQSNADGSFVLEGVPPWDAYMITVTHLDHALARIDGIALGANEAIDGVDFTLARGGTIRGQVTDEAGRGLGGIDVRYAFEHAMDDGRTILLTTLEDRSVEGNDSREVFITRGDGSFTIPRLPEGTYTLAAEARNRLPTIRQGVEVREGRETRELHLVVRPGETLAGRVVDDEGLPIVGAVVLSERPTNCMCVQIPADLTDDEGRFRLRGLAPGSQALTVNKAGFMTVKTEVDVPASETVVISLQAAGRASGLVRAPVDVDYNAVRVHVVELTGEWGGKPFARGEPVRPDTGGEFFVDLAPGSYWLVARAPGFAPGRSEVFTISVGEELAGVDIPFVTGGTRAGVVLSGESGRGVEGVRIRLEPADGSRWTLPETTTDAAGRFVFDNVAVGQYRLVAEISPRARTILNLTMVEGANPELEIVVAASRKEESRQQQAQE